MSIMIESILSPEHLKKLSKDDIKTINEAIIKETDNIINVRQTELEKETSEKFDKLVEGLYTKFDEQVTGVILENTKTGTNELINKKLYNIVKGMVNLLENSGITTTEKTKELQEKLNQANTNLEKSWHEREVIKSQLSNAEKENYILSQLKGMNPNIISSALTYFKDKDILDVQDELKTYINGDFSELNLDKEDKLSGDLDLEQVERACEDIKNSANEQEITSSKIIDKNKQKCFESLGKGIKTQPKINNSANQNVSQRALDEAARRGVNGIDDENLPSDDDDTRKAMEQIDDFSNLGLKFLS